MIKKQSTSRKTSQSFLSGTSTNTQNKLHTSFEILRVIVKQMEGGLL
jgi:hypothetical protein